MMIWMPVACSSCFFGEEAVRWAYYISAAVMFLLPLAMVGGSFRFLERISRVVPGQTMNAPKKFRPTLFAAAFIGAAMIAVPFLQPDMAPLRPRVPAGVPPVLSELGKFELTNQKGEAYGSTQLEGRVWVANFIFTRCPSLCPRVTARMVDFEKATAELPETRIVSFSIDPDFDKPEVLAKYAKKHGADESRWSFLTGPFEDIKAAVEKGLNVTVADARHTLDIKKYQNINTVLHGTRFVLIDEKAQIRGYYDVKFQAAFDQLVHDYKALAKAKKVADRSDEDGGERKSKG